MIDHKAIAELLAADGQIDAIKKVAVMALKRLVAAEAEVVAMRKAIEALAVLNRDDEWTNDQEVEFDQIEGEVER